MLAQVLTDEQLRNLSRRQRREMERRQAKERARLERLVRQAALPVTFDNRSVTASGGFGLLEGFKRAIGFADLARKHGTIRRHHNCRYSAVRLLDSLVDGVALGLLCFDHMNALKGDPGYRLIKGLDDVPDERTLRYFLAHLDPEDVDKLRAVNQALLHHKARTESPRSVWLDVDDTVMTVFGDQEGAEVGYNPRYRGRLSYKAKVAFVAGSAELVNADLYGGKTASNSGFLPFLQQTLALMPLRTVVEGVRMDKGFFDEANFTFLEDRCLLYVCKVPLKPSIRKIIAHLDARKAWRRLDDTYAVAEIRVPLPSWERARRFVLVRETVRPASTGAQLALGVETFDYEVMVTNLDDRAPEEVWRWYNQRATVENRIDELKTGLGLDRNSQHEMNRNKAFMWLKILAYNLVNWFRAALLPEDASRHEVPTIRRRVLNVPGNVVGNGRYRHIRLAPNGWLDAVIAHVKAKLRELVALVAWLNVVPT